MSRNPLGDITAAEAVAAAKKKLRGKADGLLGLIDSMAGIEGDPIQALRDLRDTLDLVIKAAEGDAEAVNRLKGVANEARDG